MHREDLQEQKAHQRPPGRVPYQHQQSSPHHIGTNAGMHPDVPYTTDDVVPDDEYDDEVYPRMPSSSRRYQGAGNGQRGNFRQPTPIPPRSSRQPVQDLATLPRVVQIGGQFYRVQDHGTTAPPKRRAYEHPVADRQTEEQVPLPEPENPPQRQRVPMFRRFHILFWIGIFFCTMVLGWAVFTLLGSWVQLKYDDALYGRPRTFQTDATVGHQDSAASPSHFECVNLNKQIQMIEFPGGNSRQAKVYEGPSLIGPGSELTVCTLSFQDVNGDGKPDMVLTIGKEIFVMINDGTSFRPVKAGEHITL